MGVKNIYRVKGAGIRELGKVDVMQGGDGKIIGRGDDW